MPILSTIILMTWVVFWVFWVGMATRAKRSRRHYSGSFWGARLILAIIVIVLIKQHFTINELTLHDLAWRVIGSVLFLSGLAVCIWSRFSLGRNWGMPMSEKTKPELVTSGPYKYIRHPIYSGLILASIGTALATDLAWLVVALIAGAYFIYSAVVEERNMLKTLPKEYAEYKQRSKMLIPFIF